MKKLRLPKMDRRFWRNPRLRAGGLSTLLLCLGLGVLFALNALFTTLEEKNAWRKDYSFNAVTTYSNQTADILEALDVPVSIYAVFERGQEDLQLLELLNRYCAASSQLTWEQTPLSLYPSMAETFQGGSSGGTVTSGCLIVYCPETDRFRVLTAFASASLEIDSAGNYTGNYAIDGVIYERELTSAIAYVTQEKIPVVWMLQGHGEVDINNAQYLTELLMDSFYDVRFAYLEEMTLSPDDMVAILAPQSDLTDAELDTLTEFARSGGGLLFSFSGSSPVYGSAALPGGMPNLRELLRLYGMTPLQGRVDADTGSSGGSDGRYAYNLYATLASTSITLDMTLAGVDRLPMYYSMAFETPEEDDSFLQAFLTSASSTHLTQDDATGPFTLALQSERYYDGYEDISRAVALGSTNVLTTQTSHSNAEVRELIVRIADFLTENNSASLQIAPKVAFRPQLSAEALTMGSVILVALPVVILGAAAIILFPRRHL